MTAAAAAAGTAGVELGNGWFTARDRARTEETGKATGTNTRTIEALICLSLVAASYGACDRTPHDTHKLAG